MGSTQLQIYFMCVHVPIKCYWNIKGKAWVVLTEYANVKM
jgi:hypothetical protein